jgi:hypothetical protein
MAGNTLKAEYQARILATSANLKAYFNDALGLIYRAEDDKRSEEDIEQDLETLDLAFAKKLVDDLAPEQHIIQRNIEVKT